MAAVDSSAWDNYCWGHKSMRPIGLCIVLLTAVGCSDDEAKRCTLDTIYRDCAASCGSPDGGLGGTGEPRWPCRSDRCASKDIAMTNTKILTRIHMVAAWLGIACAAADAAPR